MSAVGDWKVVLEAEKEMFVEVAKAAEGVAAGVGLNEAAKMHVFKSAYHHLLGSARRARWNAAKAQEEKP